MKPRPYSYGNGPFRRRAILAAQELDLAPAFCREFFWRSYNRSWRRPPQAFGDLAGPALADAMNAAASELARVRVLWQAILPAEYEGRTEVEQVGGGRLMVRVDSAATRYALGRRHGRVLLEALRRELPGVNIAEIRYRLAAGRGTVRAGGGQEA